MPHPTHRLVSAASLMLFLAASGPVLAFDFSIDQVDWLSDDGGFLAQNSEWGTANLQLGPADVAEFTPGGGVYTGYLQVFTNASAGAGSNNWAVQNKLLVFNSAAEFEGRLSDSLSFNLGVPRGDSLSGRGDFRAHALITAAPLPGMPPLDLSGSSYQLSVGKEQRLFGGGANDQGSPIYSGQAGAAAPPIAQNYVGLLAADAANKPTDVKIKVAENKIPAVSEEINGCGPGSGARSISYLQQLGLTSTSKTPQQIYDGLKTDNYMKTKLGNVANAGTSPKNFVDGKNKYSTDNKLGITTDTTLTAALAQLELDESKDVEAHVYWGKNAQGQDLGGHIAFVLEIIVTQDDRQNTISYEIRLIDDSPQRKVGDPIPGNLKNHTQWLKFDANDNLVSGGIGGTGARFQTFYVEAGKQVPEPGSAGLALCGSVLLLRRH